MGCWHGYLSGARCRFARGAADATITAPVNPDWFHLPGFTFLVPTHPGSLGHSPGGRKMVVAVVVHVVASHPMNVVFLLPQYCQYLS